MGGKVDPIRIANDATLRLQKPRRSVGESCVVGTSSGFRIDGQSVGMVPQVGQSSSASCVAYVRDVIDAAPISPRGSVPASIKW